MAKWMLGMVLASLVGNYCWAAVQDGVVFESSIQLDGRTLMLNGTGTRKATLFKVKVYAAALYVSEQSRDADALLSQQSSKQIQLVFLREISEKKVVSTWKESLLANNEQGERFEAALDDCTKGLGDLKEGQKLVLTLTADAATLESGPGLKNSVNEAGFGLALQRIWLGPNPPDGDLQRGLLGRLQP